MKYTQTKQLRNSIKIEFAKYLNELGFERKRSICDSLSYNFMQLEDHKRNLVDVTFDQYNRPMFVVDFGSVPNDGIVDAYGRHIEANKVRIHTLVQNGRLYRRNISVFKIWFQISYFRFRLYGLQSAIDHEMDVLKLKFKEIETWFNEGMEGPNLELNYNDYNLPESAKIALMERGAWPPKDWVENRSDK